MSQSYRIQSQDTKYYVISHREVEGEIVITQNGKDIIPKNSVRIQLSNFLGIIPGILILFWLDFNHNSSC
jgi:hypothetical protein